MKGRRESKEGKGCGEEGREWQLCKAVEASEQCGADWQTVGWLAVTGGIVIGYEVEWG
jgi:hypothetical protein